MLLTKNNLMTEIKKRWLVIFLWMYTYLPWSKYEKSVIKGHVAKENVWSNKTIKSIETITEKKNIIELTIEKNMEWSVKWYGHGKKLRYRMA